MLLRRCVHSAFLACSLRPGAVVPVLSRSAAHKAAPQVLVKAKKMPAIGTYYESMIS